jgi:hypothetical protein
VRSPTASEHARAYLDQFPDPSILPAVGLHDYWASEARDDDNYGYSDTYATCGNDDTEDTEDTDSDHGVSLNAGQSAPGPVARAEYTIDGNGQDGVEIERC